MAGCGCGEVAAWVGMQELEGRLIRFNHFSGERLAFSGRNVKGSHAYPAGGSGSRAGRRFWREARRAGLPEERGSAWRAAANCRDLHIRMGVQRV